MKKVHFRPMAKLKTGRHTSSLKEVRKANRRHWANAAAKTRARDSGQGPSSRDPGQRRRQGEGTPSQSHVLLDKDGKPKHGSSRQRVPQDRALVARGAQSSYRRLRPTTSPSVRDHTKRVKSASGEPRPVFIETSASTNRSNAPKRSPHVQRATAFSKSVWSILQPNPEPVKNLFFA
jgi:hypothetical protein